MPTTSETTDRLLELLGQPIASLGLDLEAVDLTAAGKRRVLRIAVDQDGGVGMDDIAAATAEVSRVLDESDVMGQLAYTLEVSSRGVDRPLTLPRHWRRNVTRLVTVTPVEGEAYTGRITAADDEAAIVKVGDDEVRVPFESVGKARIQIEFKKVDG